MVSALDYLLFIYLSSLDHLEICHWNWKLDFTCNMYSPVFPTRSSSTHISELESINGALQIQFELFPESYMHK